MQEEITITPEQAAALWEQFIADTRAHMSLGHDSGWTTLGRLDPSMRHALALAVSRAVAAERERCAQIAQSWADEIKETAGLRFENAAADSSPSKIRYLCLKTVARQIREGTGNE